MKVIKIDRTNLTPVITFNVVGRVQLQPTDLLSIEITDEHNDAFKSVAATFLSTSELNFITVDNNDEFFKHSHKYNFKLFKALEVLYEGQMICLYDDEDIQNYKHTDISNNKLKF